MPMYHHFQIAGGRIRSIFPYRPVYTVIVPAPDINLEPADETEFINRPPSI